MTPEQCLALVAADTRVREAARDVVKACGYNTEWIPRNILVASATLAVALAEHDKEMEEHNGK